MRARAIPVFCPPIAPSLYRHLARVIESRWWSYGSLCKCLEEELARGRQDSILLTTSCTAALGLVARCIAAQRASTAVTATRCEALEVIVPAITFVSTAMPFVEAGWRVRVADVCEQTGMMDTESVLRLVTPRTAAVVPVHLFGQKADLLPLRGLCDEKGLALVEDGAHRVDCLFEDSLADFSVFSFNSVKELPAGEGGALWCRREEDAEHARLVAYLGMRVDTPQRSAQPVHLPYAFSEVSGGKHRMTDVAAAFVKAALEAHTWNRDLRRAVAQRYDTLLEPLRPTLACMKRDYESDSALMYVVIVAASKRQALREACARGGISTSVHYPSLAGHPLFAADACPQAARFAEEVITLPCYPDLSEEDQVFVSMEVSHAVRG